TFGAVKLRTVDTDVRLADGVMRLEPLTGVAVGDAPPGGGKAPTGTVKGKLVAQLAPAGDVTGALALDRAPLSELTKRAGPDKDEQSEVTGKLTARLSLQKLQEKEEWDADAKLTVKLARAFGLMLEDGGIDARARGDKLVLTNVHGLLSGNPITGDGELGLK